MENNEINVNEESCNIPTVEAEPVNTQKPNPALAIVSLVCGILGVVLSCCGYTTCFSPILSIAAFVCGLVAPKCENGKRQGMATAGFILGIVGFAILVLYVFAIVVFYILNAVFGISLFAMDSAGMLY